MPEPREKLPLRDLYGALALLHHGEQVALGNWHADDPQLLNYRIKHHLAAGARWRPPNASMIGGGPRKIPSAPADAAEISSTIEFVGALGHGDHTVDGHPDLAFRFCEREIVPARETGRSHLKMDLLLAGTSDGRPIFCELKLKADQLAYWALVQQLVHSVELSTTEQRARLPHHGIKPESAPLPADIWLMTYGHGHKTFGEASAIAVERISRQLAGGPSLLAASVERIVCVHAEQREGELNFSVVSRTDD